MTPDELKEARALVDLVRTAVDFANLAAGEGIEISGSSPEDFLMAYSDATGFEYWDDLGTQAADALTALLDRTAKTEADRDYNRRDAEHLRNVVDRLNAEIDQLRVALTFYSDPTYDGYDVNITDYSISMDTGIVIKDAGDTARAALKGTDQ